MIDMQLICVVVAGIVAGGIAGLSLASDAEQKYKRLNKAGKNFFQNSLIKIVIFQIMRGLLIVATMVFSIIWILRFGEAYPLAKYDRYTLALVFIASCFLFKYVRYCYWKSKRANEF